MSRLNRILLIIVIILAAVTALVWFRPDILSSFSLSTLNPFSGERTIKVTTGTPTAQLAPSQRATTVSTPSSQSGTSVTTESSLSEKEEEVLTPFEKEIKQRHQSYQTKIYTYEPYEPSVMRNPFQRIVSTVYISEQEEQLAQELSTEEAIRRFVQPELPPGTKFTGIISSGEIKLAIIEMEDVTYIVKEGDVIQDKYFVKSIQDDKVIIAINNYEIALKLGGEEASND